MLIFLLEYVQATAVCAFLLQSNVPIVCGRSATKPVVDSLLSAHNTTMSVTNATFQLGELFGYLKTPQMNEASSVVDVLLWDSTAYFADEAAHNIKLVTFDRDTFATRQSNTFPDGDPVCSLGRVGNRLYAFTWGDPVYEYDNQLNLLRVMRFHGAVGCRKIVVRQTDDSLVVYAVSGVVRQSDAQTLPSNHKWVVRWILCRSGGMTVDTVAISLQSYLKATNLEAMVRGNEWEVTCFEGAWSLVTSESRLRLPRRLPVVSLYECSNLDFNKTGVVFFDLSPPTMHVTFVRYLQAAEHR